MIIYLFKFTSKYNDDELSLLIEDSDFVKPLPLTSYIRTHKLFTVHKSLIIAKITESKVGFFKNVSEKIYSLIKS